jgi:hypothetical protein
VAGESRSAQEKEVTRGALNFVGSALHPLEPPVLVVAFRRRGTSSRRRADQREPDAAPSSRYPSCRYQRCPKQEDVLVDLGDHVVGQ